MAGQDELGRAGGGQDPALEALQVLGRDPEILHALRHLAQRLGLEGLALVEGQQARDLLGPPLDRLGHVVEALGAFEALLLGHLGPRLVRRLDGALGVGARALRDLGDDLTRDRAVGVEVLA